MVETALCCQDVLLSRGFTAFSYASREGPGGFLGVEGDLWSNKTRIENQPEVEEWGPVKSPDTTRDLLTQPHRENAGMEKKSRNTLRCWQELTGVSGWFHINGGEARLTMAGKTLTHYMWMLVCPPGSGILLTFTLGFRMCEKWVLSAVLVCPCSYNKFFQVQWLKPWASLM